jgi:hypothetical protein
MIIIAAETSVPCVTDIFRAYKSIEGSIHNVLKGEMAMFKNLHENRTNVTTLARALFIALLRCCALAACGPAPKPRR